MPRREITADGYESTFQVNHLVGVLLTQLLLDRLRDSARTGEARVITTSSFANRFTRIRMQDLQREHRRYGNGWLAYCATKLMNILFTAELARRTTDSGITAACFHPDPGPDATPETGLAPIPSPDATPTNFATDTTAMRLLGRLQPVRAARLTGDRGSQPLVWLATTPDVLNGAYYNGLRPSTRLNRQANDPDLARVLWQRSLDLLTPWLPG